MEYLSELLISTYGNSLYEEIINGYKRRYTTIRCNIDKDIVINILKDNNISYEEVDNNNYALVLTNVDNKVITNLDIYKEGKIYLQSLSSQLPPLFMKIKDKDQVLDMCAAPGSKTTQLSMLYPNSLITACEKDKIRCDRLKYNIDKQNIKNVTILNIDANDLSDYMSFDSILLDAPCSGSGTLESLEIDINKDKINKYHNNQVRLLKKALSLLKNDSYMIYSTCSILKEENELVLKEVLNDNIEIIPINIDNVDILPSIIDGVLTIKPNEYYEGFFIALLHKK